MKNFNSLTHITDVGAPKGNGVDSTLRIKKQYERLGVSNSFVISAGHSPLHVAFAACTDVSLNAKKNAASILKIIGSEKASLPIALNSAPRNSKISHKDGKEDYMYKVNINNGDLRLIMYGPDVLKWVVSFYNNEKIHIERILSISNIIPDTSRGSQFRSAEHLPIAHVLEAKNLLDQNSIRETVDLNEIEEVFTDKESSVIVVPPDEYGNGRLIVDKKLIEKILSKNKILIPGISDEYLFVHNSLTKVMPDELSIWPSSNFFPNDTIGVLNIGTRWKPNTTRTTNLEVMELSEKLSISVGKKYKVKI